MRLEIEFLKECGEVRDLDGGEDQGLFARGEFREVHWEDFRH